jgi:hypothetical protein
LQIHSIDVKDSTGASLPDTNFWQTDRTFPFGGVRPIPEDNLHLLFFSPTARAAEAFTLVYRPADQVSPAVTAIAIPDLATTVWGRPTSSGLFLRRGRLRIAWRLSVCPCKILR